MNESQTIHLKAQVPADKTLNAYRFTLTYDATKIEIQVADVSKSGFTSVVSTNSPGNIVFNGFSLSGIEGDATASLIDVTFKGISPGIFNFDITVDNLGSGSDNQFHPIPLPLKITIRE